MIKSSTSTPEVLPSYGTYVLACDRVTNVGGRERRQEAREAIAEGRERAPSGLVVCGPEPSQRLSQQLGPMQHGQPRTLLQHIQTGARLKQPRGR
jgi:hypothetical protein